MKQTAKLGIGCLIVFYTSGCAEKQCPPCKPIVTYVKPKVPEVTKAEIKQCREASILENAKCILGNYIEMKKERDSLRMVVEEIGDE